MKKEKTTVLKPGLPSKKRKQAALTLGLQEKEPECKETAKNLTLVFLCCIDDLETSWTPIKWFLFANTNYTRLLRFRKNKVIVESPKFKKGDIIKAGINKGGDITCITMENMAGIKVKVFFERPNRILEYNYESKWLKKVN